MESNNSVQTNKTFHPILAGLGAFTLGNVTNSTLSLAAGFATDAATHSENKTISNIATKLVNGMIDNSSSGLSYKLAAAGGLLSLGNALRVGIDRAGANAAGATKPRDSIASGIGAGAIGTGIALAGAGIVSKIKKL